MFSVEAYSILHAFKMCSEKFQNEDVVTITDSLTALKNIYKIYPTHPYIQQLKGLIHVNHTINQNNITLLWTPSYLISDNTKYLVDFSRNVDNTDIQTLNTIYHIDLSLKTKYSLLQNWNEDWQQQQNNKLYKIKPTLTPFILQTESSKKKQIILNRLMTGHTKITHEYLLTKQNQPICQHCNVPITVTHLLINCKYYQNLRNSFNLQTNLDDLIFNNSQDLFKFLEAADLLKKI